MSAGGAADFAFDAADLRSLAAAAHAAYASASPFPHAVLDDVLPDDVLDAVVDEFPAPDAPEWWRFDDARERKLASHDPAVMGPVTRHVLAQLNGAVFVDFLEALTGIEGLVPDPHLWGGGLHRIEPGGHLDVHADFNRHPRTGLERRLNVLVYLNRGWDDAWGGALELWSPDMARCERRVVPAFNRMVVFSTGPRSFHGHPDPLACPPDRSRRSLALYYYTRDPAPGAGDDVHNTRFQRRPGDPEPVDEPPAPWRRAVRRLAPPIALDAARAVRGTLRERRP